MDAPPEDEGQGGAQSLVEQDDNPRRKRPAAQYQGIPPAQLPPMAPDGGPSPVAIAAPPPMPPATPELFVCLRGPCRHYWELVTHLESGNPADTWDAEEGLVDPQTGAAVRQPRQINRTCLVHPGLETDLTDDLVYSCDRWDPLIPGERLLKRRDKNRHLYFKLHPEHRPRTKE